MLWPDLPLAAWRETCETVHMYAQIVGKIRLALAYPEPEWAHVALYVTPRGLTSGLIPFRDDSFQIDFDFAAHTLNVAVSTGELRTIALEPKSVRDFHRELMDALAGLGIDVRIWNMPVEVVKPIRFTEDTTHASYDRVYVERFHRVLLHADDALKEHRAPFRGRHTRVQFFFGTFDLAYARFSGRPATPPDQGVIMKNAMDAEEICAGFWPGDDRFPEPAFWCYAYPKPAGLETARIGPACAGWNEQLGEFILRYAEVRSTPSPRDALREFFTTSYAACAERMKGSERELPLAP